MNRRNFIGLILAAPAIVRAEILMPVTKIWTPPGVEAVTRLLTLEVTSCKSLGAAGAAIMGEYYSAPIASEYDPFLQYGRLFLPTDPTARAYVESLYVKARQSESYANRMNRLRMERINRI